MRILVVVLCLWQICGIYSDLNWWRTANIYQIYPRSFKDSNGDGIGDLNGITERLPYLKNLGINAIWLSPIFKSPMADFGYDISDFRDIHEEFGTMADFDRLLEISHALNIKVLLDFVPNHSSHKHTWFEKSAQNDPEFNNYYVWHPGKENPADPTGRKLPPSNWLSVFRGSAWEFHEGRGEYYLHQFVKEQPDLNYRNPVVVEEMKNILRFWLEKGVDGFRVDAVPHLFEAELNTDNMYPDEVPSGFWEDDPDNHGYLKHEFTMDLPETVDMVYQWREVLDEFTKNDGHMRIMLTEAYSEINILMSYYGNGEKSGSHAPFNFYMIMHLKNDSNAIDFHNAIRIWLDNIPTGAVPNWVLGNHDQRRVGSRFGTHRIDVINMILNTLPGISITYNGEEIGMTDVFLTFEETKDPAGLNAGPDLYDLFSRDPARTPFQWDGSVSAGFSTNPKTWLPVSPLYREVNVRGQMSAPRSHLNVHKQLLRLRTTPTLQKGTVEIRTHGDNILSIARRLANHDTYITVVNIGPHIEAVNLRHLSSGSLTTHIVSVSSNKRQGEAILNSILYLEPYEGLVLKGSPRY